MKRNVCSNEENMVFVRGNTCIEDRLTV